MRMMLLLALSVAILARLRFAVAAAAAASAAARWIRPFFRHAAKTLSRRMCPIWYICPYRFWCLHATRRRGGRCQLIIIYV